MRHEKPSQSFRQLGLLIQVPAALGSGPIVGYFLGSTLDHWLGTDPWIMAGGLMLGTIAGVRVMFQLLRKAGLM